MVFVVMMLATGCYMLPSKKPAWQVKSEAKTAALNEKRAAEKKATEQKQQADRAAAQNEQTRQKALMERGNAVADLEGHPSGRALFKAVATCKDRYTSQCGWAVQQAQKEAPATYRAGMAFKGLSAGMMDEAEQLAEKTAAERTARAEQHQREDAAVQADLKTCAADKSPCVDRCKQDATSSACVALGIYVVTGDKDDRYDKALALFEPPCKAGMKAACDAQQKAAKERAKLFGPIDDAWSKLRGVGDDLATKKFLLAFAQQHTTGARNARAKQNMALHISAITKDDFCPAMKDFLKVSTRQELAKRAKAHCDEDPPTATGLAGKEEVLTTECRAVYAMPCP
jgi:hypothetical protein